MVIMNSNFRKTFGAAIVLTVQQGRYVEAGGGGMRADYAGDAERVLSGKGKGKSDDERAGCSEIVQGRKQIAGKPPSPLCAGLFTLHMARQETPNGRGCVNVFKYPEFGLARCDDSMTHFDFDLPASNLRDVYLGILHDQSRSYLKDTLLGECLKDPFNEILDKPAVVRLSTVSPPEVASKYSAEQKTFFIWDKPEALAPHPAHAEYIAKLGELVNVDRPWRAQNLLEDLLELCDDSEKRGRDPLGEKIGRMIYHFATDWLLDPLICEELEQLQEAAAELKEQIRGECPTSEQLMIRYIYDPDSGLTEAMAMENWREDQNYGMPGGIGSFFGPQTWTEIQNFNKWGTEVEVNCTCYQKSFSNTGNLSVPHTDSTKIKMKKMPGDLTEKVTQIDRRQFCSVLFYIKTYQDPNVAGPTLEIYFDNRERRAEEVVNRGR